MADIQREIDYKAPVRYGFKIAGPLLAWQRPDSSGKRRFNSKEQVAYQKMVGMLCLMARRKHNMPMLEKGVPVKLTVRAIFPRPQIHDPAVRSHTVKPDLDNIVKSIKDALNGVAWRDDSQVCKDGGSEKVYGHHITESYAVVEIEELPR